MSAAARQVLVTGGTGGIGQAIVRRLAADGYQVSFTWARAAAAAQALAAETGALAIPLDLAAREAVAAAAAGLAAVSWYGLVHNAAATYDALAATLDVAEAAALFQCNLFAPMQLTAALLPAMSAARSGRIIAIGALAARRAVRGNAAYAASKAALEAYIRTLSVEIARRGLTANVVAPGWIAGRHTAGRETLAAALPGRRFGTAAEVAGAVAFLLGPDAAYVNGATLAVDGGLGPLLAAQS